MSSCRSFHCFPALNRKQFALTSSLARCLCERLQMFVCFGNSNHSSLFTLLKPCIVLKASTISPFLLLSYRVVRPASFNFSLQDIPLTLERLLTSLCCTFSRHSMSSANHGCQAANANSSLGCTSNLQSETRVSLSLKWKDLRMSPSVQFASAAAAWHCKPGFQ